MKNELWQAVYETFEKLEEFFGDFRKTSSPQSPSLLDDPEPTEEAPVAKDQTIPLDDLLHARSQLRSELDQLRTVLAERLSERDAYLVLFPMVAHFDELVQTRFLGGDKLSWPPLQRELFQIDDAGELFFETLDDILLKPQTLPFILEVFYFCLNDGFLGRYNRNAAKIIEYMERLRAKIPVEEVKEVYPQEDRSEKIQQVGSPYPYYIAAAVVLVAFYFLLVGASQFYNPLIH